MRNIKPVKLLKPDTDSENSGKSKKQNIEMGNIKPVKLLKPDIDSENSDEDYTGLEEPPIRRQLQNILRQYPDGPQIIKELVQNAEDANASVFKIMLYTKNTMDECEFDTKYKDMLQGPALCAFNDAVFTENDWKGIKRIYTSVKETDVLKIGRFGLGFKSVFHMTDTPLIVSRDQLLIINPTERPHRICHNVTLSNLTTKYRKTLWPVLNHIFRLEKEGTFGFDMSSLEQGFYHGTLFWFPLRRSPSLLLEKIYPPERMIELITSFTKEADNILLFLHNVNKIIIMENEGQVLYENTIEKTDETRKDLVEFWEYLKNISTNHETTYLQNSKAVTYNAQVVTNDVKEGRRKTYLFKIIHYFQGKTDMSLNLMKLSKQKENIPLVGVAYPMQFDKRFVARVFCFLPLPFTSSSLTDLPVHVNGFFNLDPSRDHVMQATEGQVGEKDKNIQWNELLIQEVIPKAYIKLIEDLLTKGTKAEIIYRCLPDIEKVHSDLWKRLLPPVLRMAVQMNIFQTEKAQETWVNIESAVFNVFVEEERMADQEIKNTVIGLIKDYNENLVMLPEHLKILIMSWPKYNIIPSVCPTLINSEYIASLMNNDSLYRTMSRKNKIQLLDYFLTYAELESYKKLELIPTNDESYFLSLTSDDPIYLCSEEEAFLFPNLEIQLLSDLSDEMKRRLLELRCGNIKNWSPEHFVPLLRQSTDVEKSLKLDLGAKKKWIQKAWTFLSETENQHLIEQIELCPVLLAKEDIKADPSLHVLKKNHILTKTSHLQQSLTEEVKEVLKCCGVKLLEKTFFLPDFVMAKYVAQPTVKDVCMVLEKTFRENSSNIIKFNNLPESVRKEFAIFIGEYRSHNDKMAEDLKKWLRKLELFPLSNVYVSSSLYAVENVAGIAPPHMKKFPVRYNDLLLDRDFKGISLARELGCQYFPEQTLIKETLQSVRDNKYESNEVILFMNYFMDKLNDDTPAEQIEIASKVPFIENGVGELKAPTDLFDPSKGKLKDLFCKENSYFPKECSNLTLVGKLQKLKIKSDECITFQDLINTVQFIEDTNEHLNDLELKKKVQAIFNHLKKLSQSAKAMFVEEVKGKRWIPVMKEKSESYPKLMKWKGKDARLCKPLEACLQKYHLLVGSVCYVSRYVDQDELNEYLEELLNRPKTHFVFEQLKHLVKKYKNSNKSMVYDGMLKEIYEFLAEQELTKDDLAILQLEDAIPTKSSFTNSSKVYIDFLPHVPQTLLEPHKYQINEKWVQESKMRNFFVSIGCKETLTSEDLISVQENIKDFHTLQTRSDIEEIKRDLKYVTDILDILKDMKEKISKEEQSRILFPVQTKTKQLVLMPALQCTYTDEKHSLEDMDTEEEAVKLHFVHENVRVDIAECFGVPSLTRREMENGGIEDLEYEQWGQQESLTTRIKNILKDYSDGPLFKEMLQNADDAGATCMKILYDERKNEDARTGLIDKGMEECQGPALWFYNDAKFKEKDFKNIIKLGGGTKETEHTKIGKFGLGFCSVYSVTDVPSIVSGKYIVFFDPRTIHLGKAIKDKSKPGLRIPISKIVKKFRKQFKPYDKIFHCDFTKEDEYEGTLFRLPLRTANQALEDPNGISTKQYSREEVISVVKKFMDSAGNLLLFTQNVKKIELHFLNQTDEPDQKKIMYSVEKSQCENIFDQMKAAAFKGEEEFSLTFQFDIEIQLNPNLPKILDSEFENVTGSSSRWIVSWAALQMLKDLQGPPLVASTAMPLTFSLGASEQQNARYGFFNTGHVFCFLPLPQESQMKVHLNGNFAVEQSRKSIVAPTLSENEVTMAQRNYSLISNVLSKAYLSMLENVKLSSSAKYHTLWPLSQEGNVFNPLVSKFYADICQKKIKIFFRKGNSGQKFSLKECKFLDSSLQDNDDLGKTAYQLLVLFNPFPENIMYMPFEIQKEFMKPNCKPHFLKQICSEESFFLNVFLKNLAKNFWESDEKKNIRRMLLKRIFGSGNKNVLSNMTDIECIPTKPNGRLRKPIELVNEHSHLLHGLFSVLDERFPEDELLDVKKTLICLGMNNDSISDEMLIERVNTIKYLEQSNFELAKQRCNVLIMYLLQNSDCIKQTTFDKLKDIPFLPVMTKPNGWPFSLFLTDVEQFAAPSMLYRNNCKFLIGSVKEILDESGFSCSHDDIFCKLAIKRWEDVNKIYVIEQLKKIADIGKEMLIINEEAEILKKICKNVYCFLDNYCVTRELEMFQRSPCILISVDAMTSKLVEPYFVSFNPKDDVPPYIHKIDDNWCSYHNFFKCVGVHDKIEQEFIIEILNGIKMVEGKRVDNLSSVIKLYNLIIKNSGDLGLDRILLPDLHGVMRKPKDMCFEDGNDMISTADHLFFTHSDIKIPVCKLFKVASKSAKFIKKFSSGVSFGQKEELFTRLKNILKEYPCDISILNELVQNADDAQATEIHFVYDKRSHSEKELFDDSMKCLQGPALVVYNNSCFSQEDIDGISKLGEGSKSSDPNQTGQFGIGFNAVYHITDVPSFLTKGTKTPNGGSLIMFDPHCKYVPDATPEDPGLRVDDLKLIEEKYSGVYNTYLQKELPADSGTWFRLPLRTNKMASASKISEQGEIEDSHMLEILESFQNEMSKSLLFLRNLKCIKLSEIDESGDMLTIGEVTAFVKEGDSYRIEEFHLKCKDALHLMRDGNIDLGANPGFSCDYCIELKGKAGEKQWHEDWAISNVFGTMKETVVKDVLKKGYKKRRINLLPRAGIAACLRQTTNEDDPISGESENPDENLNETMRAFCFLPLPHPTGLPVHINGHFALDSNRTNIWTEDQASVKGSWNELILNEVLPFAYISAIQFLKQLLFSDKFLHSDCVRQYNNFFPVMKHIKDDIWKKTVGMFYLKVLASEINLFPMLFDKETFESMRSTNCISAKGALKDRENSAVVFVPLISKQHHFPAYFDKLNDESENEEEIPNVQDHTNKSDCHESSLKISLSRQNTNQLSQILKMLGLKLLSSSSDILESIQESLIYKTQDSLTMQKSSPKTVEIGDIFDFLKSWNSEHVDKCRIDNLPIDIRETVLKNVSKVKLLLAFCFKNRENKNDLEGIPLCVLNSGLLTCFSKSFPKIASKFCHLLECSKDKFVCKSLVSIFQNKAYTGVIRLTIKHFAELLQNNISNLYSSNEPVEWKGGISSQWLNDFWEFLSTNKETVEDCKMYLSNWCLVPTEDRKGQMYLYPFQLAYAVMNNNMNWKDEKLLGVLSKLGFPKLKIVRKHSIAAHLCASESTPENILSMFCYQKNLYKGSINTSEANQVLLYLLAKLHKEVKDRDSDILNKFRNTCLFETLDGHVTDITMKRVFTLMDEDSFPKSGVNTLCEELGIIILKRKDLLEDFEILNMSQEDFYADIFLKSGNLIDNSTVKEHVEHIVDKQLYLGSRQEKIKELISGIAWIKNAVTGDLQKASEFYSPHLEVCKLLCSEEDLLPKELHSEKWRTFLESLGMKTVVPFKILLKFGRKIESLCIADYINDDIAHKSQVLVKYIFNKIETNCIEKQSFLREFRKIKCILPFKVPMEILKIIPHLNRRSLICFEDSVLSTMWNISWSRCNLVPETTVKVRDTVDLDILGVKSQPDVVDVISHIHMLCCYLQNSSYSEKGQLMKRMYKNLETYLENSTKSAKEEVKRGLSETPFIYHNSVDRFLRPFEVALCLEAGKSIDGYLYKGPEKYGNFNELFRLIGVCDQPVFYHYLRTFNSLHEKISSKIMTPEELDISLKAFTGLLESLNCENCDFSQLPHLYLPSENDKLVLSTDIVLCDRLSIKRRIAGKHSMMFLKSCTYLEVDNLNKLPPHFKPKLLSTLFTEQVEKGPDCENDPLLFRISKVFHSDAFFNGVWICVQQKVAHFQKQSIKQKIRLAFLNVRIQTVEMLRTILFEGNVPIESTAEDKSIYYKRSKDKIMIYIKAKPIIYFEKCFEEWKGKLWQVVCLCAEGLLSMGQFSFIQELLLSESDDEIMEICKKHEIELDADNWLPSPGTSIPVGLHDTLDNTFCEFSKGEIAAYERIDPLADIESDDDIRVFESEFIYVRILEKEESTSEMFPTYIVFDGENDVKVCSVRLFKFVRKIEKQSKELELFSAERIQFSETSLDAIKGDIERRLKAAWKLSKSYRRAVIKRLLLQWHPDKNPTNVDQATKVTQFILDVIGKLERGEIGVESSSAGYSASSSYHYGASNYWTFFQGNVNRCNTKRRKRHFDYTNRASGGSYTRNQRLPNPQPAVGLQWIKQAKYDVIAANQQLMSCSNPRDRSGAQTSSRNEDAVTSWNWICYKAHQSCEKALKAALYSMDANVASDYQTSHDLSSLSSAHSSLSGTSLSDLATRFSTEITGQHTAMRYPTGGRLPGDSFTREQAEKAVDIAQQVLDECENCVS
ncbi:sacsin-like [Crassostrea angulata]|uniref:sacsin-like n=1 Tax=Magallana angulata TaxID=2784310 RepID=UPI0022B1EEAE|nr:sacsin-like [Crassostrea angulata]